MKIILGLSLFFLFVSNLYSKEIAWKSEVRKALEEKSEKPLLLYFTASWCGPCKLMKSTTLKDEKVKPIFDKVSPIMVDFDEHVALAQRMGVKGVPCIVLLNQHKEEVGRQVGYVRSSELLNWWEQHEKSALSSLSKKEQRDAKQKEVASNLEAGGEKRQEAKFIILMAIREDIDAKTHEKMLRDFWKKHPKQLEESLRSKLLFERIVASRSLSRQGNKGFDPWGKQEERDTFLNKHKNLFESKAK